MQLRTIATVFAVAVTIAGGYWWSRSGDDDARHRDFVRQHLVDPESAKFRSVARGAHSTDVWCGELNSRNRMGGMVGFTRYIAYVHGPDADSMPDQLFIRPGPSGSGLGVASTEEFDNKWSLVCR